MYENTRPRLLRPQFWCGFLFWFWNIVFICFMLFGFVPVVLPELFVAVRAEFIQPSFIGYGLGVTLVPVVATLVGFIWLRRDPVRLFALGYGIEAPLMMLLGLRFFLIRDMTLAVSFMLGTAVLGLLAYGWHLFMTQRMVELPRHTVLTAVWFFGLTLLLVVGLYLIVWLAFYVPPFVSFFGEIITELRNALPTWQDLRSLELGELRFIPFFIFGVVLFLLTGVLLIALPLVVTVLYARAWWRSAVAVRHWALVGGGLSLVVATWLGLFALTNQQPQQAAFEQLADKPKSLNEAEALLDKEKVIKDGLLNAYLAPFRYVSADGESDIIINAYAGEFELSTVETAQRLQARHDMLARPLLYRAVDDGNANSKQWGNQVFEVESAEAAALYQQYFDQSIIEAERETIVDAVGQTWNAERGRQAVQAVDDREVYLSHQEITVHERGDWAEIELYEVYENRTLNQQEVVYYFSLPETAVLTGVWLGNSDDRSQRFAYRVSPRGAAQEVYQSQVRIQYDPALLEQIGPTQYRLRVFPVEPMQWDDNLRRPSLEDGPPLHLWLTFNVLADGQMWPLPRLAEKFNVYWDRGSERLINGEVVRLDDETWLPEAIEAVAAMPLIPRRVDLNHGMSVVVEQPDTLATIAANAQLAVVLDRSRSMADYSLEVTNALAALDGLQVDVYQTASSVRPDPATRVTLGDKTLDEILYFGGQHPSELLAQFYELRGERRYDAVLVITDGAGYTLGPATLDLPTSDTPIWFVHLGGDMPIGYDDDTLEAIQSSGGGSVGTVEEALQRIANQAANGSIQLVDGLLWTVVPTEQFSSVHSDDDFAPFATRFLILSEMVRQRQNLDQLESLDELHALAVEHSVVTPYSSMIVLVTEAQHRLLDELEQGDDRFEREYEALGETETFNLNGVPEPHEWLLLLLSLALAIWYWRFGERVQPMEP